MTEPIRIYVENSEGEAPEYLVTDMRAWTVRIAPRPLGALKLDEGRARGQGKRSEENCQEGLGMAHAAGVSSGCAARVRGSGADLGGRGAGNAIAFARIVPIVRPQKLD